MRERKRLEFRQQASFPGAARFNSQPQNMKVLPLHWSGVCSRASQSWLLMLQLVTFRQRQCLTFSLSFFEVPSYIYGIFFWRDWEAEKEIMMFPDRPVLCTKLPFCIHTSFLDQLSSFLLSISQFVNIWNISVSCYDILSADETRSYKRKLRSVIYLRSALMFLCMQMERFVCLLATAWMCLRFFLFAFNSSWLQWSFYI